MGIGGFGEVHKIRLSVMALTLTIKKSFDKKTGTVAFHLIPSLATIQLI